MTAGARKSNLLNPCQVEVGIIDVEKILHRDINIIPLPDHGTGYVCGKMHSSGLVGICSGLPGVLGV